MLFCIYADTTTMKSFSVLCAYNLSEYAFKKNEANIVPFLKACTDASAFPHCEKLLILTSKHTNKNVETVLENTKIEYEIVILDNFTVHTVFSGVTQFIAQNNEFENAFFLYADLPCIDLNLTKQLFENHIEYHAEYSFVDGYPEGFAPEILAAGLCNILLKISENTNTIAERNFIFETIKKEINNYDIETLIAPTDLRHLRLRFAADSKRNAALCGKFAQINSKNYAEMINQNNEELFTLPAYYSLELSSGFILNSIYKPEIKKEKSIMPKEKAFLLIEKIAEYSDDAVISLSIFGEPSLYTEITEIIEKILSYPKLSVLIETSGLNWTNQTIERIQKILHNAPARKNGMNPIYWIVCIDAVSSQMYAKIHSIDETDATTKLKQAVTFVDFINKIFTNSIWVQIVRMNENEIEVEPFYRFWKDLDINIIIQKFDSFCKTLPDKRVADLSPFERHPCWHLKRDMCVFQDGTVPLCREDFLCKNILGNAFTDDFNVIRQNAFKFYKQHTACKYTDLCGDCDEYYTYNF